MLKFSISARLASWLAVAFVTTVAPFLPSTAGAAPFLFDTVNFTFPYSPLTRLWWVDYNRDSRIDFAATGFSTNWGRGGDISFIPGIYQNDGSNTFTRDASLWFRVFTPQERPNAGWADFDNDNRPDFLIVGETNSPQGAYRGTFLLRNQGSGVISTEIPLRPSLYSTFTLAWGDFDNDGKIDLIAADGYLPFVIPSLQFWKNMGDGSFSNVTTSLRGLNEPAIAVGDFDNDGWLDLAITGSTNLVTEIWRNDHAGNFTRVNPGISGVRGASAILAADFDNDGWLDLLVGVTVYHNNHDGTFSNPVAIPNISEPYAAAAGDFDNDGRLDVVLGLDSDSVVVFHNEGTNGFTWMADLGTYVNYVDISLVDFNHDGKLDISWSGLLDESYWETLVSRNSSAASTANSLPTSPTNLVTTITTNGVWLSWSPASDAETPSPGLTYNVRVGSAPGGSDIVSALSNPDGFRIVPGFGNASHRTNFFIRLPAPPIGQVGPHYYWSVQAVDSALAGGMFAEERSFMLAAVPEFRHLARETNGITVLFFAGSNQATYTVESSEDLVHWTERAQVPASGTEVYTYADETTLNVPFRFYRVRFP